jgi:hypothetical protein
MSTFRILLSVLAGLAGLMSVGCGPNCQSTCNRLYSNGDDYGIPDCSIERGGTLTERLISDCLTACNDALANTGEVGDYRPDERHGSSTSIILENELQAAMWMDCIAETSCEDLESGYCAPIW